MLLEMIVQFANCLYEIAVDLFEYFRVFVKWIAKTLRSVAGSVPKAIASAVALGIFLTVMFSIQNIRNSNVAIGSVRLISPSPSSDELEFYRYAVNEFLEEVSLFSKLHHAEIDRIKKNSSISGKNYHLLQLYSERFDSIPELKDEIRFIRYDSLSIGNVRLDGRTC